MQNPHDLGIWLKVNGEMRQMSNTGKMIFSIEKIISHISGIMALREGDVIATIREYIDYIAHIHTAGVPGRHELDESQELYYPAIMRAIADLGFEGYVAHEYLPIKDPVECLTKAVELCNV